MARIPRRNQMDLSRQNTFHVVSRCVRQLHLFGGDDETRQQRKGTFLAQLEKLARFTAIDVAGFSVMDNHVHLLLRINTDEAEQWTARQVAERWLTLHPPRNGYYKVIDVEDEHIAAFCADADKVAYARDKLCCLSQFMKELKQEVAQQFNKLDKTIGPMWAGRFKCKPVTDETYLLTALAYIDLNPFAANACESPEDGKHTTLDARLNGANALRADSDEASAAPAKNHLLNKAFQEQHGWWLPIGSNAAGTSSQANRLLPGRNGFTFQRYLDLLNTTAHLLRPGKRRLTPLSSMPLPGGITPRQIADTLQNWITHGIRWTGIKPQY